MLDWLNTIPFWAVLSMMPVLVVFELFVTASKMTSDQKKRATVEGLDTFRCFISICLGYRGIAKHQGNRLTDFDGGLFCYRETLEASALRKE
jgi:hypothetical protein